VTRGEAIDALNAGLTRLPIGIPRSDLIHAFNRLQLAAHVATAEGVVRQAYDTLLLALPELKPAVDKLLADWTESSHAPKQ